ncbi:hypothetical protein [Vibrio porteresiae]|uniref:Uncharacterized protein n=1 Tax=Vibrio porteresiae DSM 19223 TaxID=1123496 RepID=A0ABZ0Q9U8_9VIBR|nr:hypothetical protein [Vibrio porteresiae]WPC72962.1 hypothetical protein R8Z52_12590 [Vibrio porteresiae DSM 19223]
MAKVISTQFGTVTVSDEYFSTLCFMNVVNLTLIKPENDKNGYGVCREIPSGVSITESFVDMFASEASQLL